MKYYATFVVDTRYIAEVEADSLEEAKEKAEDAFSGADFGVAGNIDGELAVIEDEDGDYVWEID